jgi:hypothetical protein
MPIKMTAAMLVAMKSNSNPFKSTSYWIKAILVKNY